MTTLLCCCFESGSAVEHLQRIPADVTRPKFWLLPGDVGLSGGRGGFAFRCAKDAA